MLYVTYAIRHDIFYNLSEITVKADDIKKKYICKRSIMVHTQLFLTLMKRNR